MSSVNKNEKTMIFETILSGPGMEELVKVALPLSRKNILVLCRMIEQELVANHETPSERFFGIFGTEVCEEFEALHKSILNKAGLENFYAKLKSLE